mmetsp:Transcript_132460/g.334642  ORF Transcript_132460/g.334642 Transcript_132460/m.334642 type:complete len:210 (-) Transcript_132460:1390-2019(-)
MHLNGASIGAAEHDETLQWQSLLRHLLSVRADPHHASLHHGALLFALIAIPILARVWWRVEDPNHASHRQVDVRLPSVDARIHHELLRPPRQHARRETLEGELAGATPEGVAACDRRQLEDAMLIRFAGPLPIDTNRQPREAMAAALHRHRQQRLLRRSCHRCWQRDAHDLQLTQPQRGCDTGHELRKLHDRTFTVPPARVQRQLPGSM